MPASPSALMTLLEKLGVQALTERGSGRAPTATLARYLRLL
jgi:hypothetical protein